METKADNFFLESEQIGLRPVSVNDASAKYLGWLNDPEVTRGIETGIFPNTIESLQEYLQNVSRSKSDLMFAIIEKVTGAHVGNVKLANINWVNRNAQLGIIIGDRNAWGKKYGTEACKLVIDYAFSKINLHKVWLVVYANNPAARAMYEKVGFHEEGHQKEHVFSEGKFVDAYLMAVHKSPS